MLSILDMHFPKNEIVSLFEPFKAFVEAMSLTLLLSVRTSPSDSRIPFDAL